jgi:hypothetical protein
MDFISVYVPILGSFSKILTITQQDEDEEYRRQARNWNKTNLPTPTVTMEWTNCQKLPKNGTQNIPNTYKNNPKLFATEIFEISSKIYSKTLFLTGN